MIKIILDFIERSVYICEVRAEMERVYGEREIRRDLEPCIGKNVNVEMFLGGSIDGHCLEYIGTFGKDYRIRERFGDVIDVIGNIRKNRPSRVVVDLKG